MKWFNWILSVYQSLQENNIYKKTTLLEFLFNKVAGLRLYSKETSSQEISCRVFKVFKNTYFEDNLGKTASEKFNWILSIYHSLIFSIFKSKRLIKIWVNITNPEQDSEQQ